MCRGTRSLSKGNGPVSLFIVSTYCRFLRSDAGPVPGRPYSLCPAAYNRSGGRAECLRSRSCLCFCRLCSPGQRRYGSGGSPPAWRRSRSCLCFCRLCSPGQRESPLCVKGGQHGAAMQGGLTPLSYILDISRRAIRSSGQSHRRHSPPPPFAQGRPSAWAVILSLVRCPDGHTLFAFLRTTGPARERSMGPASRWPRREARKGSGKSGGRTAKRCCRTRSHNRLGRPSAWAVILSLVRCPDGQAVLPHPITQPAFVPLPSAAAQVGSSVTLARRLSPPGRNLGQPSPQGRLCPYISRSSFSFLALSASTSLMNLSVRFWMSFSAIL